MNKIFLLIIVFCVSGNICYSQLGKLDPSFGTSGIIKTGIGVSYSYDFDNSSVGTQVLLQQGGGIFVVVNAPILNGAVIAKRLSNGQADVSYGNKGFSDPVRMSEPHAALQADGKIVVVGWMFRNSASAITLARYNTDGRLDSTFNRFESETIDFGSNLSIAIQKDGKIVVAGSAETGEETYFALARYNSNGSLDRSFGIDGKQLTSVGLALPPDRGDSYPEADYATSVIIQGDGKIVESGYAYNYKSSTYDFALVRLNTNGTLDNTFDKDGKQTTDFASSDDYINAATIQSDGKIVVAGSTNTDYALARYNTDGSLDKTFNLTGKQKTDFGSPVDIAYGIAIQADGKIVVSGSTSASGNTDFGTARYNKNGSLDKTFNKNGKQIRDFGSADNYANSVAVQADGKIIIEGYTSVASHSDFTLGRYNADGSLDNTFSGNCKLNDIPAQGNTNYESTTVQKDGKIVAVGTAWNGKNFDFAVARYNVDGSLDKTFSTDGKQMTDFTSFDDKATTVALQSDGKIVVAGVSDSDFAIARYNTNGSLDISFNKNGKQKTDFASSVDEASSVAIQSDGKIVLGGTSNLHFAVVRYNINGSLDNTFSRDGKQTTHFSSSEAHAYSAAVQKDGKIVLAGTTFFYVDGYSASDFALARYNSDGSLDFTFDKDGRQTTNLGDTYNFAYSVAIQKDGKIVAAGSSGGNSEFALARYNTNGSLDKTFSDDGMQTSYFDVVDYSIAKSVAIENNGKIVLAGEVWKESSLNFGIARYSANGSVDKSFGKDGMEVTAASNGDNFINGITIANNKLYVAGVGRYPGDFGVIARYVLEKDQAPAISIAVAGDIVKYSSPSTIKINTTAKDEDGEVTKVEFFNGAALLYATTEYPYAFTWKNVPAGNYTITAKATDNTGLKTTSNSIKITVVNYNVPPIVSITTPADNTTYISHSTVHINVTARDANDKISKVEFYNGSKLLTTDYSYPYSYSWTDAQHGIYTITAKATDDKGLSTTSSPIVIKVTNLVIQSDREQFVTKEIGINNAVSLKLGPNPAGNVLQIYAEGLQQNKQTTISIISTSGVIFKTIQLPGSNKVASLDVSSLVSGLYTIKVMNGNTAIYKQFLKL